MKTKSSFVNYFIPTWEHHLRYENVAYTLSPFLVAVGNVDLLDLRAIDISIRRSQLKSSFSATRCHATDTRVQSIVDVHVSRPRRLKAFEPIRAEAFSIFIRRKFRARCWLRRWQGNPSVTQYKHRKVTHTAIRGQSKR